MRTNIRIIGTGSEREVYYRIGRQTWGFADTIAHNTIDWFALTPRAWQMRGGRRAATMLGPFDSATIAARALIDEKEDPQ